MYKHNLLFILGLLFLSNISFGQSAKQRRADRYFDDLAYAQAVEIYEEIVLKDKGNEHVMKRLADSYRLLLDWENAEYWYSLVVESTVAEPIDHYYYAQALKANRKYEAALSRMEIYAKLENNDSRIKHAQKDKGSLRTLLTGSKNILVKNLNVSSKEADFGTAYFKDKLMVFSSSRTDGTGMEYTYAWNDRPFLDLYVADISATGELTNPRVFAPELNTRYHEGPVVFAKSDAVIYFTRNNYFRKKVGKSKKDINNLKIYKATRIGDTWGKVTSLHFNSDEYSCGHPTLSADGERLYFVSDMPGGYGGTDIYMCEKSGNKWSPPINLGEGINTEGNEMFPSMHQDGTLYFSSDGLFGLGGLDIFMAAPKDSLGTFDKPMNLANPINSSKDDFAFIISENKDEGYFSSNRDGGQGDDDIYYFKLEYKYDPTPQQVAVIDPDEPMMAIVEKPDPVTELDSLAVGETAVLKNIYYDLDKWFIRPDAEQDLELVIKFLQKYPTAKIELSSHTDCRAPKKYNMELSRKRAVSAVMYIVVKGGIDPNRLIAKGYGETKLTNRCADGVECSEEEHQANRRTEVKLLEK